MYLNEAQIKEYFETGLLIIEKMVDNDIIRECKNEISFFQDKTNSDSVIYEDNEIRSIFAPHKDSVFFSNLYKDQKIVDICSTILNNDIYLYQYKLNLKAPFVGNHWEWHQDFPYWNLDDTVENPNMISVLIYLDDTKCYQGPLMVIPGSHKEGIAKFKVKPDLDNKNLINSLSSNLKYTIDNGIVKKNADKNGIKVLEFDAGTVIFFHPNLFHASTGNLSPYSRDTVIITYNSIYNLPLHKNNRPDFICSRDFTILNEN